MGFRGVGGTRGVWVGFKRGKGMPRGGQGRRGLTRSWGGSMQSFGIFSNSSGILIWR